MNEDDLKKMFHENFRFKNARFYEIDSFANWLGVLTKIFLRHLVALLWYDLHYFVFTAADMTSCPEGEECDGDAVTEADTDTSKDIHAGIGF